MLTNAKDNERLQVLKEVAGTQVYEQRRQESLKIMTETDLKRTKINELLDYIQQRLDELEVEKQELSEFNDLDKALEKIANSTCGVAVLLNVDSDKSQSHHWFKEFESKTATTLNSPAIRKHDFRTYGIGAQILKDQGVGKMQLMNKPGPLSGMAAYQLEVVGYIELQ